jgi:hypothetical protein
MDFIADCLASGRMTRILTMVNAFTRESLGLKADTRSCLINLRNATTRPMGPAIEAGLTLPLGAAKAYMRQLLAWEAADSLVSRTGATTSVGYLRACA